MTLDILADLLHRVDASADGLAWVSADEISSWPAGTFEILVSSQFLRPAADSNWVDCDECLEPHSDRVLFHEGEAGSRPFIPCPTNGRTFIDPNRLKRWRVSAAEIAETIALLVDSRVRPRQVQHKRLWHLGIVDWSLGRRALFLKGNAVSSGEAFSAGGPDAIFLSLGPESQIVLAPICIPLIDNLTIADGRVAFDQSLLSRLATDRTAPYAMSRTETTWTLTYDFETAQVPASLGLSYLALLLASPERAFSPSELVSLCSRALTAREDQPIEGPSVRDSSFHTVIDGQTVVEVRKEIAGLDAKKQTKGLSGDEARKLADLQNYLQGSIGLGGRSRRFNGPGDRARTSVTNAITRSYRHIAPVLPLMVQHLRQSVLTGSEVRYTPNPPIAWLVDQGAPRVTPPVTMSRRL